VICSLQQLHCFERPLTMTVFLKFRNCFLKKICLLLLFYTLGLMASRRARNSTCRSTATSFQQRRPLTTPLPTRTNNSFSQNPNTTASIIMASLHTLPRKLVLDICSHLQTRDIYRLLRTNRYLYHLLKNRLYENPSWYLFSRVIEKEKHVVFRRFLENNLDAQVRTAVDNRDPYLARLNRVYVASPGRMRMLQPLLEAVDFWNWMRKDLFYLWVRTPARDFGIMFVNCGDY
jgi:hypothetical protein